MKKPSNVYYVIKNKSIGMSAPWGQYFGDNTEPYHWNTYVLLFDAKRWKTLKGVKAFIAKIKATASQPDFYFQYDITASYEIAVTTTEKYKPRAHYAKRGAK